MVINMAKLRSSIILLFTLYLLIYPAISLASEFTASVNDTEISLGEEIILKLTLSNEKYKSKPDITKLRNDFMIRGQGESSTINYVNGEMSSNINWIIHLSPNKIGKVIIPSISINAVSGKLSTEAIEINVSKSSKKSKNSDTNKMTFVASTNKKNFYKNEAIIYKLEFISRVNVADVTMDKLEMDNTIIEQYDHPQMSLKVIDGRRVNFIEIYFSITPLKEGKITIPSFAIKGQVVLDHDLGFQGNFGGFMINDTKPFIIYSNAIDIEVKKPPIDDLEKWIPAKSIKITDSVNTSSKIYAGDPIERNITLHGLNITDINLPDIKDLQKIYVKGKDGNVDNDIKIYSSEPVRETKMQSGNIISSKTESYNIIAPTAGVMTLSEINLEWWDTKNNKVSYTKLPERTIEILPRVEKENFISEDDHDTGNIDSNTNNEDIQNVNSRRNIDLYNILLAVVVSIMVILVIVIIILIIKMKRNDNNKDKIYSSYAPNKPKKLDNLYELADEKNTNQTQKNDKGSDIEKFEEIKIEGSIDSVNKLLKFIQDYSYMHWNTPKNAILKNIFTLPIIQSLYIKNINNEYSDEYQKIYNSKIDQNEIFDFIKNIEDNIYAGKKIDVKEVRNKCELIINYIEKIRLG